MVNQTTKRYLELKQVDDTFIPIFAKFGLVASTKDKSLTLPNYLTTAEHRSLIRGLNGYDIKLSDTRTPFGNQNGVKTRGYIPEIVEGTDTLDLLPQTIRPYALETVYDHLMNTDDTFRSYILNARNVYADNDPTGDDYRQTYPNVVDPFEHIHESTDPAFAYLKQQFPNAKQQKHIELNHYINRQFEKLSPGTRSNMFDMAHVHDISYRQENNKHIFRISETFKKINYIEYDPTAKEADRLLLYSWNERSEKGTLSRSFIKQTSYKEIFQSLVYTQELYEFINLFSVEDYEPFTTVLNEMTNWNQIHRGTLISETIKKRNTRKQSSQERYLSAIASFDPSKDGQVVYDEHPFNATNSRETIPNVIHNFNQHNRIENGSTFGHASDQDVYLARINLDTQQKLFFLVDKNNHHSTAHAEYAIYTMQPNSKTLQKEYVHNNSSKKTLNVLAAPDILPRHSISNVYFEGNTRNYAMHLISHVINKDQYAQPLQQLITDMEQLYLRDTHSKNRPIKIAHSALLVILLHKLKGIPMTDDVAGYVEKYVRQIPIMHTLAKGNHTINYRNDITPELKKNVQWVLAQLFVNAIQGTHHKTQQTVTVANVENELTEYLYVKGLTQPYTLKNTSTKTFNLSKQMKSLLYEENTNAYYFPNEIPTFFKSFDHIRRIEYDNKNHSLIIWSALSHQPDVMQRVGNIYDTDIRSGESGFDSSTDWSYFIELIAKQFELLGKLNIHQLLNHAVYLRDQESLYVGTMYQSSRLNYSFLDVFQNWKDYLHMANQVNTDFSNKSRFYVRHLLSEHQRVNILASLTQSQKRQEEFKDVSTHYAQYNGQIEQYSIIVADEENDLINESNALGHCVQHYISKMSNEQSVIFFLRETDALNEPLVTVEVVPGQTEFGCLKIVQQRGKRNRATTIDEQRIIKQWQQKYLRIEKPAYA